MTVKETLRSTEPSKCMTAFHEQLIWIRTKSKSNKTTQQTVQKLEAPQDMSEGFLTY